MVTQVFLRNMLLPGGSFIGVGGRKKAITEVLIGSKSRGSEKTTFNIRITDQIQFFPSESQSFREKKKSHI